MRRADTSTRPVTARFTQRNHAGTRSPDPPSCGGGVNVHFPCRIRSSRCGECDRRVWRSVDRGHRRGHGSGRGSLATKHSREEPPARFPPLERREPQFGPFGLLSTKMIRVVSRRLRLISAATADDRTICSDEDLSANRRRHLPEPQSNWGPTAPKLS